MSARGGTTDKSPPAEYRFADKSAPTHPALYVTWYRIKEPSDDERREQKAETPEPA